MRYWDQEQGEQAMAMSTMRAATTMLVATLTSLSALVGCSGGEQAQGNTDTVRATADAHADKERTTAEAVSAQERGIVARAGDTEVRIGDGVVARAGAIKARAGGGAVARAERGEARTNNGKETPGKDAEDRSRRVALEIGGVPGTKFSGTCAVGREERTIGGWVPARYVYEPDGHELECEIRKWGAGTLEVVLTAGDNVRSVQRTTVQRGTINFAYSGSGISSSIIGSSR